jgi:hypothetical protein
MKNIEELNLEFYKQLKEEYRQYGFYIQSLTNMKFVAIAGIISIFIANEKLIEILKESRSIASIGILLIPLTAFFIDLKVLEITLHVRFISKFLSEKYAQTNISDWERLVWSKQFMPLSRTYLTLFTSTGISFVILWTSLFLVGRFFSPIWATHCLVGGIIFSIAGILFTTQFFKKIWESTK